MDRMPGTSRAKETKDQQVVSVHLLPSLGLIVWGIRGGSSGMREGQNGNEATGNPFVGVERSAPHQEEDLAIVLGHLLERLLDGVVVPFLGAGLSNGARSRTTDAKDQNPYDPRVGALVKRLVRSLLGDLKANDRNAEALRALLFPSPLPPALPPGSPATQMLANIIKSTSDDNKLIDDLAELSGNRLERWTEVHAATRRWAETVDVLRIDRMADLEPQPAHAYLAYLAREGLVREVITTNYDTCLELALERTLMPAERRNNKIPVKVVRSLTDYRDEGATVRAGAARRPVLHVYKINGCAKFYCEAYRAFCDAPTTCNESQREEAAERIVLTERQLQSFRSERWAEDLVRDRSRSRALLFCGFGSDEPQVRHTLLAVAREFTEHRGSGDANHGWDRPNAPFMVTYEPTLSFNQYQVMRGYADAHIAPPAVARGEQPSAAIDEQLSNVVGGRHRDWFDHCDEHCLPADRFWRRVFQAVFLRLVDRVAGHGGQLRRWLQSQGVNEPATIADGLRTWLGIPTGPVTKDTWFGRRSVLLDQSCHARCLLGGSAKNGSGHDVVRPLVLSLWLLSIQGLIDSWCSDSQHQAGPGHPYFPLREDPLLVVLTLLVVSRLVGDACDNDALVGSASEGTSNARGRVAVTCGLGLRITSTDGGVVYLVADNYKGTPDRLGEQADDPAQVILQIVIPKRDQLHPEERLRLTSSDMVRAARLIRVPVSDWLVNGGRPSRAELVRQWAMNPAPPRRATVENLP